MPSTVSLIEKLNNVPAIQICSHKLVFMIIELFERKFNAYLLLVISTREDYTSNDQ